MSMYDLMDRVYQVCVDPTERIETRWVALHGLRMMRKEQNRLEAQRRYNKRWSLKNARNAKKSNL